MIRIPLKSNGLIFADKNRINRLGNKNHKYITMKKTIKSLLLIMLGAIVVVAAILLVKTSTHKFAVPEHADDTGMLNIQPTVRSLERLAGGIRIPTVSEEVSRTENNPFDQFKEYLPEVYPAIYEQLDTMTINEYGLLFRWKGKDRALNPILFLSHYDVVPVVGYEPEAPAEAVFRPEDTPKPELNEVSPVWEHHPFSGAVADGRIYGRGTLDMKGMLFAILEAADNLLDEGYQPERDIWFAFGFDEEVSGLQGALKIAEYFKTQGITFDGVYDEGGIIAAPGLGGIDNSIALIGTAEKGFLTLGIKVLGTGGHSSMPPAKGSLVLAAEIIEKLNTNQMPARLIPPIAAFLDNVGGEMGYASRMAIANQWLLGGMLFNGLSQTPATNALIRTTTAVTMAKGSDADNVMASVAEIVVNFRILTGETVADVIAHVEKICEGYETEITMRSSREPSNPSDTDTRGYKVIEESIKRLYPDALITPYLTIGGTDAYKYEAVSNRVYRLMPVYLNEYEQRAIHNENEFITLENYGRMIEYFRYIMENF